MRVEVLLLEFGVQADIFKGGKLIGTMLGVTMANLCQSIHEVYHIDIFGQVGLN
jgi:hypothetical protein